ncbi:glycoside hydrolase family 3 C-terminal domain-containing protein [Bifidobacterium sp. ESL0682]|uniref:beta-glucosidase n=1 Tax=Bifidobacterium sp. ESL0682 TaxID=2983212 RepID=UPI0023F904FD|nr:glycoside hydrolase family 3 C-terminal domain-containing protein [Bifidobacterium sp. ESL0682]WEV42027.1 glycoside hydrolase family 3 C-terminal domain-containing protein [Bifidobacterium sp. ESL0682]
MNNKTGGAPQSGAPQNEGNKALAGSAAPLRKWRGLFTVGAFLLSVAMIAGTVLETYRTSVDAFTGTRSEAQITDHSADKADSWNYKSEFKTAKSAYEGFKSFAINESQETMALLKNEKSALPISKNAKITMFGVRSYAPVYGSSMGSQSNGASVVSITDAFKERGFDLNPSMTKAYQQFFSGKKWAKPKFGGGGPKPEYEEITKYNDPSELSLDQLAKLNPQYASQYDQYNDAAIVVVGRPGGENGNGYLPGKAGRAEGVDTVTGNILSLDTNEMAMVHEAEAHFKKVIVLVNSVHPMEIANLKSDPKVNAIMWIGYPGCYGFYGVADVLNGTVSPSAHLGDVMAVNSALAPAMANYGNIPWKNASKFAKTANVNSYLIEAEGIYTGYRYYETRYADTVAGGDAAQSAKTAKAGTYANADGTPATADGTWEYGNEVSYPFGYGLSYTKFSQKLDGVKIRGDKKAATVSVTSTNTGNVPGKAVVQLYASVPYTKYDKQYGVEKSAIQLMDFEKTKTLKPGESQSISMNVDMANLASYDSQHAKTYIVDPGSYYFAIGDDAHDALNNVLAAQGHSTSDGMTAAGDKSKTYTWKWDGNVDARTFSTSDNGKKITNQLSKGDYATDFNAFEPGTVKYLTRSDWSGTFPKTYSGLSADAKLTKLLNNDFVPLTKGDTSAYKVGDKSSHLKLSDLKGASFNDKRWGALVSQVSIPEFMKFAEKAFHAIGAIPSVGLQNQTTDDGPGGSDSHTLSEGKYQGKAFPDAKDPKYANKGTTVAPAPTNLAYSWNKELGYRNGQVILGETGLIFNLPIVIGPAMNLHRHAYNTRAVEYYSEDPILSGFMGSSVTQGEQSKGTMANVKHFAFNDQEINRSGVAPFMSEQRAREMELRNFEQAIEAKGEPASFKGNEKQLKQAGAKTILPEGIVGSSVAPYKQGALGIMTSYNRGGAVPVSANYAVSNSILRQEWGFTGYAVTDFTSVAPLAAPKESILAGTMAFCGFGNMGVPYWNADTLGSDPKMVKAIQTDLHYALWAIANSNAMNGVNSTTHTKEIITWWRAVYIAAIVVTALVTLIGIIGYVMVCVRRKSSSVADAQPAKGKE